MKVTFRYLLKELTVNTFNFNKKEILELSKVIEEKVLNPGVIIYFNYKGKETCL